MTSSGLGQGSPRLSTQLSQLPSAKGSASSQRDLGGSARNMPLASPISEVLRLHPPNPRKEAGGGRGEAQTWPLGWGFSGELSPPLSWVSGSLKVAEGFWGLFGWGTAFLSHL